MNSLRRSGYPSGRLAAVLVLLFERAGELRVLLTTRDKSLRAHPGQVALPGGKVDVTDADVLETAVSTLSILPHPNARTACPSTVRRTRKSGFLATVPMSTLCALCGRTYPRPNSSLLLLLPCSQTILSSST